jgi:BirA family transcriptional regulator, biotin operon repressor / biotin---[acetyl-CoA-carboxylase] ligase
MSEAATAAGPEGTRFYEVGFFEEIDSTNRYLLDRARAGALEGLVAVAGHQSAGRGRLDRRWEAEVGTGLLLSVLLRPRLEEEDLHLVTLSLALAARSLCLELGVEARLKWPNDLVVGEEKLGGILAESLPDPRALVVGLGLNVSWSPPGATCLSEWAAGIGRPSDLVDPLLRRLEARLSQLDGSDGRRMTLEEYRRASATIGHRVSVTLVGETLVGRALDINDHGHLLVEVDGTVRIVTAGDVVHLRSPH